MEVFNSRQPRRKRQSVLVLFQESIFGRFGEIAKPPPYVASGSTGEVFSPDLVKFLWKLGVESIGVERLRIRPVDLCRVRIDAERGFLADREPLLDGQLVSLPILARLRHIHLVHCLLLVRHDRISVLLHAGGLTSWLPPFAMSPAP